MKSREQDSAQHEAAHVVVGVALGLRLRSAEIYTANKDGNDGHTWFPDAHGVAGALMYAAGIAWSDSIGKRWQGVGDLEILRGLRFSERDIRALKLSAAAMLSSRVEAHRLVTQALLNERKITGADVMRLARKES